MKKRCKGTRPVRLPSTPTPPKRPKARPRGNRGTDHHHPLYSTPRRMTATFAGRARAKKLFTVGRRGS
ncbi:hypothetical protein QBC46DRAFT_372705, partial [Diplogelasinospora grovesii]